MKKLLILATLLTLGSCGKVESPQELFDFVNYDHDTTENIEDRVETLEDKLEQLGSLVDNSNTNQDILSDMVANNIATILTLEGNSVSKLIDPCGDKVNAYDEILIQLGDGTIFGYFEQGNKRFLTVLGDGNYRTTDAQQCHFSITNGAYHE